MNLTIRQLEILAAVGDAMSFTAAAEALGISQPAVSETIRRVEVELGMPVIDRTTRKMKLTPEGQHIIATAREAVRYLHHSLGTISDHLIGQRNRIAISALPSAVCSLLSDYLPLFLEAHPNVDVNIYDVAQGEALTMLNDGIVDAALLSRPEDMTGLEFHLVFQDALHAVCHRGHPLARMPKVTWHEFQDWPFIAISRSSSVRQLTDAGFLQAGISVDAAFEVRQIPSASALASAGLGITILPSMTLSMVSKDKLSMIPLVEPVITRQIGFVFRKERLQSPTMSKLIQFISDRASSELRTPDKKVALRLKR
ncbi:LysR family transcriptional regulator [Mesorhizobium sp. B4-1-4]|uniref:LysR family transcriptional regulator n=1 Tax=Mesorhizobium sp. B4-1-4 TaxID=2589888 RepID=UPI00112C41C8|nr:LysR family transcriptional regulator [Mesorhizobium sp. B4-1-4]UCI31976.1 LysR family transcriptional regulator [Mesorhizobium sp. B4-1-4]